jgi:hypothetical protein
MEADDRRPVILQRGSCANQLPDPMPAADWRRSSDGTNACPNAAVPEH